MNVKKYISLIILASFFSTFFTILLNYYNLNFKIMADPVWGQLAKAQDDSETIEEAIVRLIGEHESDAGAHTGAGESLETHKSQEIVDHPAGSILIDKETFTEVVTRYAFESIDNWSILDSGWLDFKGGGVVDIGSEWIVEPTNYIKQNITWPSQLWNWDKNWLIQFIGWTNETTGVTAINGFIDYYNKWGFGIEFLDGDVRGFTIIDGTYNYTSYFTIDHTAIHTYRAIYEKTDEEFRFYVDGVLKGTIAKTDEEIEEDMMVRFQITPNQDGGDELHLLIKSVITSIEI
jgi:hypothetical protein